MTCLTLLAHVQPLFVGVEPRKFLVAGSATWFRVVLRLVVVAVRLLFVCLFVAAAAAVGCSL